MGLCHSLIEKKIHQIGADLKSILWIFAFSLLAVFLLVKLVTRVSESTLERVLVPGRLLFKTIHDL